MALGLVLNRAQPRVAEASAAFGTIAERCRRAGEWDRAVALCREGLVTYPRHVSAQVTLGWALLDLGRFDEAREQLEAVVKQAPDNLAAIRGLAELHERVDGDAAFGPWTSSDSSGTPREDVAAREDRGQAARASVAPCRSPVEQMDVEQMIEVIEAVDADCFEVGRETSSEARVMADATVSALEAMLDRIQASRPLACSAPIY
jgi:tetratricopeptide (TPR) repeat protein